ncbi:hypothetical protein L484_021561 [Morus notabilis]|uniref:Uncharacterized protein n=1 Tax=Morus notabilis TaxID=981085 RepID=W9SH75_9ROSA|nr:hypothetical protein L484_021561 [Morus notabilis]
MDLNIVMDERKRTERRKQWSMSMEVLLQNQNLAQRGSEKMMREFILKSFLSYTEENDTELNPKALFQTTC